jgi:uncharacterized membrane protein
MVQSLVAYGVTALVFATLDFVWLSTIGQTVYRPALKDVFIEGLRWAPAIAFYLIYVLGVVVLAVLPGVRAQAPLVTAGLAAMLGLVAYATYDLTNMATLKTWPLHVALLDIAWGVVATSVAATVACWATIRSA